MTAQHTSVSGEYPPFECLLLVFSKIGLEVHLLLSFQKYWVVSGACLLQQRLRKALLQLHTLDLGVMQQQGDSAAAALLDRG